MQKIFKLVLVCFVLCSCEYSQEEQKIYDEVYTECINQFYEMYQYCECQGRFFAEHFDNYSKYKDWMRTGYFEPNNPIGSANFKQCAEAFQKDLNRDKYGTKQS